jgi:hypothetical protein
MANSQQPCDLAPHIFSIYKRKKSATPSSTRQQLDTRHQSLASKLLCQHFVEYICPWHETARILLRMGTPDALTWKFKENGQYSALSTYHAQFIGATCNNIKTIIWNRGHPLNVNSLVGFPFRPESRPLTVKGFVHSVITSSLTLERPPNGRLGGRRCRHPAPPSSLALPDRRRRGPVAAAAAPMWPRARLLHPPLSSPLHLSPDVPGGDRRRQAAAGQIRWAAARICHPAALRLRPAGRGSRSASLGGGRPDPLPWSRSMERRWRGRCARLWPS